MTEAPIGGAFAHQHRDPRGLHERIEAQIRDRIEEAMEMAGLKLLVDHRARHGRPAPVTSSETDRRAFEALAAELLVHVRWAFYADLGANEKTELERAEAAGRSERERLLAGQTFLARRLPDYWQRLELHQAGFANAKLEAPSIESSWLRRLFG
ncbi:MAG: hypothetical protein C5B48_07970 [Candidatus Rokuibacteriota bacterium]|nr:MAG: hypothetical protein C5B48_07970 [Candidatus Rokubacteria bacterium]